MTDPVFTGVGVALATLFADDGEVALEATAGHAARLVDLGVRGVVVAGSTGEAAALSAEERAALVRAVRAAVPGDVPVLAGTGAPSARAAVALTRDAVAAGADAVLVLSPPQTADPTAYYEAVAKEAAGLPVLAYHYPAVSAPGIAVDLLPGLPVQGLKDSSGEPERLLATLEAFAEPVYTGAAPLLVHAGAIGCAGAILALANVAPEECAAAFAGDGRAQRAVLPVHLAARRFPHGLKAAMAHRFGTPTTARMG